MTAPAAISGDFCTFRHVQGRKVLQIVIEVPAEAASAVFATLGMPGSGAGIPVGIARLNLDNQSPGNTGQLAASKERRTFSELPCAQQAAIRCGEFSFQDFLCEAHALDRAEMSIHGQVFAAEAVRFLCKVESRRDLDLDEGAGQRWQALEAEYYAWQRGMR